jgi:hypothetical protein
MKYLYLLVASRWFVARMDNEFPVCGVGFCFSVGRFFHYSGRCLSWVKGYWLSQITEREMVRFCESEWKCFLDAVGLPGGYCEPLDQKRKRLDRW